MATRKRGAKPKAAVEIRSIADLLPDVRNARRRTPRSLSMIEDALREVGAARSIVINREGKILAGNGTVEAAANAGIEKVRVVRVDGDELVAVMRDGLTERQEKRLALYDNRTGELAEWDPAELTLLRGEDDQLFAGMFFDDELDSITIVDPEDDEGGGSEFPPPDETTEHECPKCGFRWS